MRRTAWPLVAVCLAACATTPAAAPSATDLHWQAEGSGRAVVLLGGGGMDLRQWDEVAANLARDHRVVRFDHRGWGRSPTPTAPYSRVDDVRSVLDAAGVGSALLVGSSFGGGVALDFALAHPERVDGLVLVGPELGGYAWSPQFMERGARFAQAGDTARIELLLGDPHFIPAAQSDPALSERARRLLRDNLSRIFALDASLVRPPAVPAIRRLEALRVPVLVVTPGLDHPDLFAIADTLTSRLPDAVGVVIEGAGHLLHMERPGEFAAHVRAYGASLARQRANPATG